MSDTGLSREDVSKAVAVVVYILDENGGSMDTDEYMRIMFRVRQGNYYSDKMNEVDLIKVLSRVGVVKIDDEWADKGVKQTEIALGEMFK